MIEKLVTVILAVLLCSCGVVGTDSHVLPSEADLTVNGQEESSASTEDMLQAGYRKISAFEARDMMLSSEAFILLDVRTEDEYREIRIDGAILIPDFEIADRAEAELPDKSSLILEAVQNL